MTILLFVLAAVPPLTLLWAFSGAPHVSNSAATREKHRGRTRR